MESSWAKEDFHFPVQREVKIRDRSSLGFFPRPGPGILRLRSFNGIFPCSFLGRCARAVKGQDLRQCPKLSLSVMFLHNKGFF